MPSVAIVRGGDCCSSSHCAACAACATECWGCQGRIDPISSEEWMLPQLQLSRRAAVLQAGVSCSGLLQLIPPPGSQWPLSRFFSPVTTQHSYTISRHRNPISIVDRWCFIRKYVECRYVCKRKVSLVYRSHAVERLLQIFCCCFLFRIQLSSHIRNDDGGMRLSMHHLFLRSHYSKFARHSLSLK